MAFDCVRLTDASDQPSSQGTRLLGMLESRLKNNEFVPAEARHRVRLAHATLQTLGDGLQQRIPNMMTERVVHGLEVVEIEPENRDGFAPPNPCERLFHLRSQAHAVRQTGQRVMLRHMGYERLRPQTFGHVHDGYEAGNDTVIKELVGEDQHLYDCAIRLQMSPNPVWVIWRSVVLDHGFGRGEFPFVIEIERAHREKLLSGVAIMGHRGVIDRQEPMARRLANPHGDGV